jgi:pimeloyl-ACP methyl ester carboxylesterase
MGAGLVACSPARVLESARLLGDVSAGAGPSSLKEATPAPSREAVLFRIDGRAHVADLYRPGEPALGAMVVVPGAAEGGKDDPRLVAFAASLARARFTVLVPDIGELRMLNVRASDAREIADAVVWLAGSDGMAGPVGIFAISYSVGPAVLAALEPDVMGQLSFIVGVGGYYDLNAVVAFFTTGYYREAPDAPWRYLEPNAYGKWVFVRSNLGRVASPGDRLRLEAIALRKLGDLEAPIDDLAAGLGPEGRSILALLDNREPERVRLLIAGLPEAIRVDLDALNLALHDLGRLEARLVLIHGRADSIIPFSESGALALAAGEERTDLYIIDGLSHVGTEPGLLGSLQLWRAIYRLLELRDEGA